MDILASRSVISGLGVLCTTAKLIPSTALSQHTVDTLASLREQRPRVTVVFWLAGTADELGLSSTDYYECASSSHSHSSRNNSNISSGISSSGGSSSGTSSSGSSGGGGSDGGAPSPASSSSAALSSSYMRVWSPSAKDAAWGSTHPEDVQVVVVEIEASDALVTLAACELTAAPKKDDSSGSSSSSSGSSSGDGTAATGTGDFAPLGSITLASLALQGRRGPGAPSGPEVFVSPDEPDTDPRHPDYTNRLSHLVRMGTTKKNKFQVREVGCFWFGVCCCLCCYW